MGVDPLVSADIQQSKRLDNLAWHALTGPQMDHALLSKSKRAARYLPDIAPFAAFDEGTDDDWNGLAELVGPSGVALLTRSDMPAPASGWAELARESATQYVAGERVDDFEVCEGLEIIKLGRKDLADLNDLSVSVGMGAFRDGAQRAGTYLGVRRNGQLIAMAGQRMRCEGFTELSTVCVHPSARRQGLGAALTAAAVKRVRARGDEPLLHVREDNIAGHSLYTGMGFVPRAEIIFAAFQHQD